MRQAIPQTKQSPGELQDQDEPLRILDKSGEPAPIDLDAFGRKAGRIIAKGAAGLRQRISR